LTVQQQQLDEAMDRAVQVEIFGNRDWASLGPLFLPYDTTANNKNRVLAYDSTGAALTTSLSIGDHRGNWAAATAYVVRDIVRDSGNGNVYFVNTAHTSSGSLPISSNTDVAKFTIIVDGASATASATAAAASAVTATEQAVISTAQAVISTAQAVISTTKAAEGVVSAATASTQASTATTQASTSTAQAVIATAQAVLAAASAAEAAATAASIDHTLDDAIGLIIALG